MTDLVIREDRNGLCTLTLNRTEKLNALNVEVFMELRSHVDELKRESNTIGCVVLKGNGRCFSAGHDLKDLEVGENPPYENYQAETIEHLANLPQTVISAVHGHCYTGALELALAGDIILAAQSARFADTHTKWALTPIWGMSQRLPRRIGYTKAKEMMLTAKTYTAEEAMVMGLANMCVADDCFEEAIDAQVKMILANSWFSNRAIKRLIEKTDGMSLKDGLQYEIDHTEGTGPDKSERINAFTNKK